jgi:hypothetical protein
MIPFPFLNRDLHILQGLKVKGLLSWLSQDTHPAWLLPELRVRVFTFNLGYSYSVGGISISVGLYQGWHN